MKIQKYNKKNVCLLLVAGYSIGILSSCSKAVEPGSSAENRQERSQDSNESAQESARNNSQKDSTGQSSQQSSPEGVPPVELDPSVVEDPIPEAPEPVVVPMTPVPVRMVHAKAIHPAGGRHWSNYAPSGQWSAHPGTSANWVVEEDHDGNGLYQYPQVVMMDDFEKNAQVFHGQNSGQSAVQDAQGTPQKQWMIVFPNVLDGQAVTQATFLHSVDRKDFVGAGGSRVYSAFPPVAIPLDAERQERSIPLIDLLQSPAYGPDQIQFNDHQVLDLDLVLANGVSRQLTLRFRIVPEIGKIRRGTLYPKQLVTKQTSTAATPAASRRWSVSSYEIINPTQRQLSLWVKLNSSQWTQSVTYRARPQAFHIALDFLNEANRKVVRDLESYRAHGHDQTKTGRLTAPVIRVGRVSGLTVLPVADQTWKHISLGPSERIVLDWEAYASDANIDTAPVTLATTVFVTPPLQQKITSLNELQGAIFLSQLQGPLPAMLKDSHVPWHPWQMHNRRIQGSLEFEFHVEYDSEIFLGRPHAAGPDLSGGRAPDHRLTSTADLDRL